MLIPVSTISRWPAASARRTSASTTSGGSDRSAPRARGMMQYVQKNEQPSWTLTNARVRSTEARSSAAPSSGAAATASTPDSVGSAASSGACGPSSGRSSRRSSASSSPRNAALSSFATSRAPGSTAANASGPDLHRAARDDDLGVGVRPARAADGGPRLLVGRGRHRAGVDEVEVRRAVRVQQRDPRLAEEPGGRLHLGLVDLAAEVDDGRRPGPELGHHSTGFVDIRNAISPTAVVIP